MKKNIVIGILVAAVAYDGLVNIHNRKIFENQKKTIKDLDEKMLYLATKLDEHNIPCDKFDDIVMNF